MKCDALADDGTGALDRVVDAARQAAAIHNSATDCPTPGVNLPGFTTTALPARSAAAL